MADQPSQMQGVVILTAIEAFQALVAPEQVQRIAGAVDAKRGSGTWARLIAMRRLTWTSAEDFAAIVDGSFDALGETAFLDVWGQMGRRYLQGAFGTVLKGFQSAFGISPPTVMKALGAMWSFSARNAGSITYEPGAREGEGRMLFEAPPCLHSAAFLAGFCQGLGVIFDMTNTRGRLTPKPVREGCVALEAKWESVA